MPAKAISQGVELVFLQSTPFCNLDCRYCYLPNRGDKSRMTLETLRRSLDLLERLGTRSGTWCLVWHVGEPLVVDREWYRRAHALCTERLAPAPIEFHFQTNATLLTREWADFVRSDERIHVAVSLDGPAWMHDPQRTTRRGAGTHAATLRGVGCLKEAGLSFDCISVVTEHALDHADEFFEFFAELGPRILGINAESVDGANARSTLYGELNERRYRRFLRRIADLHLQDRRFAIRNFVWAEIQLGRGLAGNASLHQHALTEPNRLSRPWSIVSIDSAGGVHTFAPSLLGMALPHVGRNLGNVHDGADRILAGSPGFDWLEGEIARGIAQCRGECPRFAQCGGGSPSHKWFERQSFSIAETSYCRFGVQADWDEYLAAAEELGQS